MITHVLHGYGGNESPKAYLKLQSCTNRNGMILDMSYADSTVILYDSLQRNKVLLEEEK